MTTKTVAIIGAGRVGSAVGFLLRRAGYAVVTIASRTEESAKNAAEFIGSGEATTDAARAASRAELVFIATPDSAIKGVCEKITAAGAIKPCTVVIHLSGAHSLDLLDAAQAAGGHRVVLHPLQSLASREEGIKTLPGSYFRIEADSEALQTGKYIVKALKGSLRTGLAADAAFLAAAGLTVGEAAAAVV